MTDGYYYCLNCHSEITPDYNEHCSFCGTAAVAVDGDYTNEEVERAFELLDKEQKGRIVIPPCKDGDTVYMITPNGNIRNLTILSIDIEIEKKETKMTCLTVYEFEGKPCYMQVDSFKFGKTVFSSPEEAEKALKNMKVRK